MAKVLIAEDNVVNQKIIEFLMRKLQHEFKIVSNGEELLAELEKEYYPIIFMDLNMPVMDGYQATAEIFRRFTNNTPKIIALTGESEEVERVKAISAGMVGFITKPLQAEAVTKILETWK